MAKAAKKVATKSTPSKAAAPKKEAAPAKKVAAKAGKKAAAKQAGSGLAKPLTVSADLAKVIGNEPMPRTQIIKKIWDYIKANDLQDKENRRMINGDDTLKKVFGGKDQVSMFELAKVVNNHVK